MWKDLPNTSLIILSFIVIVNLGTFSIFQINQCEKTSVGTTWGLNNFVKIYLESGNERFGGRFQFGDQIVCQRTFSSDGIQDFRFVRF